MLSNVEFYSEGSLIKAHLYTPNGEAGNAPYPTVLLCHGFAGVKELLLPSFAKRFAQAGYVAMTFDYRGFGESEGEKGKLSPVLQIQDIRNAMTYLSSLAKVDASRICLWGTSYGGANVIAAAAADTRPKCLSVQLTFGDGERVITGHMSSEEKDKFMGSLGNMWQKAVVSNRNLMLTLPKLLSDEQSKDFYKQHKDEFPALAVKLPFLTLKETIDHKPERLLEYVTAPMLITAAGKDAVNPPAESSLLYERARCPKELFVIDDATHYEVYSGPHFEQAVAKQIAWFDAQCG